MTRLLTSLALLAAPLFSASTASWEMNTYQDFLRGRFTGVSLTRDGRILLAPRQELLYSSDQPAVWSVAQAPDGTIYLGTGHRGRVFRIDANGSGQVVWTADRPEIFALAVDAKGVLFAATSPDGKIYRLGNGGATEYFAPNEKYIWSLAFGKDGALYAGTGEQGKVFRITGPGQGGLYYETGQAHVTSLAADVQGRLLAGTEPNGILYRIAAKDKAFVLYDAALPEIRSIVPLPDGTVYAAALGGSVAKRTAAVAAAAPGAAPGAVSAPVTSITVTDSDTAAQAGPEKMPKAETRTTATTAAVSSTVVTTASPALEMLGVEKSAVYRINPDNTVETLWTSKDENVYDLLISNQQLYFSTDGQGRIYLLSPDRKVTLVAQTNESETTRLLQSNGKLLAATGPMGKLYRYTETLAAKGEYESPVHDAGTVAKWGELSWRGEGSMTFRVRSGNSARPDNTWSDWSASLTNADGSAAQTPNARYVQWKAEFAGAANAVSPALDNVTLAYLPQNSAPAVKSITITPVAQQPGSAAKPAQNPAAATGAYSITVSDTGEVGTSSAAGTPSQTLARAAQQMVIAWAGEDLDGDRLVYALSFRGDGEQQWKPLRTNMQETSLTLDGDILADGKYYFRVVTSDKLSNPPDAARDAELISPPVLIDNTPPTLAIAAPQQANNGWDVSMNASDGTSPLRRAEYSIDASAWIPMQAADGVTDGLREQYRLRLEKVTPGEHLLVVRVYDAAGNAGLAKVVIRQ